MKSYPKIYENKQRNNIVSLQMTLTMQVCILSVYIQVNPYILQGLQKTTEQ